MAEKTYDTLEAGDVLTRDAWGEHQTLTIEGKIGRVYLVIDEHGACTYSADELKVDGWKLPKVEEKVKEMTVAEVEALVGKKVKIVKE